MKKIIIMTDRARDLDGFVQHLHTLFPGCEIQTRPRVKDRLKPGGSGKRQKRSTSGNHLYGSQG